MEKKHYNAMLAFLFVGILFMPCYNENFQTKMSLCQASVCVCPFFCDCLTSGHWFIGKGNLTDVL